jgi:endonuclease/exonuclease/phosphatase family metal-dependent hydrolase
MIKQSIAIIAFAILLLFLIQSAGTLVESIYILDLLKTSLDEKALGVLFFFSPLLLFIFRKRTPSWAFWLAFALLFLARSATPYVNTLERMVVSGVATGTALILFPLLLGADPKGFDKPLGSAPAQGLALAIGVSVLLRTLNYTIDLSLTPESGWIGWVLGAVLGLALARFQEKKVTAEKTESSAISNVYSLRSPELRTGLRLQGQQSAVASASLGLLAVLTLVYFAFSSPGVIARWTEGDYVWIVSVVSLFTLGWLFWSLIKPVGSSPLRPVLLFIWNLIFVLFLFATIWIHTVQFPNSPGSLPVIVGSAAWYEQIPLALMLISMPILFLDFDYFARTIVRARPSPRQLAPGFLLGSVLLVALVFMNIFSNVWGYVEPVSGFFRGKFWLPFVLAGGILIALAPIHADPKGFWKPLESPSERTGPAPGPVWGISLGAIFVLTLAATLAGVGRLSSSSAPQAGTIRVMTYNIQQANDVFGEKSYDRQLALIREVDPDVLGLQESDSARISLGNNDYVRYFTGKLGYYSYYGPKTVNGTFGTALLSKYPLESPRTIYSYSDADEVGTTEAVIRVGDLQLAIFNVHPAGSDEVMMAFASRLLEQADQFENVIAMGDYNLRESDQAYQEIAAEFQNAWLAVYPTGIDDEGLDMSGDMRIDHIFVSPHLEVLDAVYWLPPESATDHPVHWADIGW